VWAIFKLFFKAIFTTFICIISGLLADGKSVAPYNVSTLEGSDDREGYICVFYRRGTLYSDAMCFFVFFLSFSSLKIKCLLLVVCRGFRFHCVRSLVFFTLKPGSIGRFIPVLQSYWERSLPEGSQIKMECPLPFNSSTCFLIGPLHLLRSADCLLGFQV